MVRISITIVEPGPEQEYVRREVLRPATATAVVADTAIAWHSLFAAIALAVMLVVIGVVIGVVVRGVAHRCSA